MRAQDYGKWEIMTQVWPAFYEPLDLAGRVYRANQSADGLTFTEFSNKGGVLKLANVILCIVDDAGATNYLAPFVYVVQHDAASLPGQLITSGRPFWQRWWRALQYIGATRRSPAEIKMACAGSRS